MTVRDGTRSCRACEAGPHDCGLAAAIDFETSCVGCAQRLTDEAQIRADERERILEEICSVAADDRLRTLCENAGSDPTSRPSLAKARSILRELAAVGGPLDRSGAGWVPAPDPQPVCGVFQPPPADPYRCTEPAGHDGDHRASIDGRTAAQWPCPDWSDAAAGVES